MKTKKSFSLTTCFRLGLFSNICFVVFLFLCLFYYYLFGNSEVRLMGLEIVAYACEGAGFVLMLLSILGYFRLVRQRYPWKLLLCGYLLVEILLMLLDFRLVEWNAYNGAAPWLIVVHSLFSAGVCLSYLTLEPGRKKLQIAVGIASALMLAGMISLVFRFRVYGSILVNAFAYIYLNAALLFLYQREDLEIDCYGDRARVQEYKSSTFFE